MYTATMRIETRIFRNRQKGQDFRILAFNVYVEYDLVSSVSYWLIIVPVLPFIPSLSLSNDVISALRP